MTASDVTLLIGWLLGAFSLGYCASLMLTIFKRAANQVR